MTPRRSLPALLAAALGLAGTVLAATPARAEPATAVSYPVASAVTPFDGYAFDTCAAPPLSAIQAWSASRYRAVGVYIGGINRTCAQVNLTTSWVYELNRMGWRALPIYMGLQAPCSDRVTSDKIDPAWAGSQGRAAAADAVAKAKALGMFPGSAVYLDVENYDRTDTTCRTAVLQFVSAWTKELHRVGFLAGVYANLGSGAADLAVSYSSASYARPDALWIARWDGDPALTGWAGITDTRWSVRQRAKQFQGDHNETWGGVTLNIDSDRLNAPVASVAQRYSVTSGTALSGRTGPSSSYPVAKSYPSGSQVSVLCQTPGQKVGTTTLWDRLSDGNYVSDYYVSTPSQTTWSAPVPRCRYPYQVTSANGLNRRSGPSSTASVLGSISNGGLAWVWCQRPGSKVGTTTVWDRLDDNSYVTDYYVATPSGTTYSSPLQRC